MFTSPVQLTDVIYNAANQTFEATVTLYDAGNVRRYACAINAPITMSFEDAAKGLKTNALRQHTKQSGLSSFLQLSPSAKPAQQRRFDLGRWLQDLMQQPVQMLTQKAV